MTITCLTYDEIKEFHDFLVTGQVTNNSTLNKKIESANNWETQVVVLSYLFTWSLARNNQNFEEKQKSINRLYEIPNEAFIEIQECGWDFINFLMRRTKSDGELLDQSLIEIENDLIDHNYAQSLRN